MSWESYEEKHSVKWQKGDNRPATLLEWIVVVYVGIFTTICTIMGLIVGIMAALPIALCSGLGLILLLLVGNIPNSRDQSKQNRLSETQPTINTSLVKVVKPNNYIVRK